LRCALDVNPLPSVVLVALTSIHWRESWKYGERAFRYCQHDVGHAVAAVAVASSLEGWRAELLPDWSGDDIARLGGADGDDDYVEAEREEPGCLLALVRGSEPLRIDRQTILAAADRGRWHGHANQLSVDHVQWTFIDQIAQATRVVPLERAVTARAA